jgi:predicted restriction endonuclease
MKFTRNISYQITKIQLSFKKPTEQFKQEVIKIAPNYPKVYLESWHRDAHKWIEGKQDTSKGPGTDSFIGFLDAALEMNYNIDLIIQATKKWQQNSKREKTIQLWLSENYIQHIAKIIYPDEIQDKNLFEGSKKQVIVNAYERSSQARKECLNEYGYKCSICKFDFEKIYGKIGKGFIHVHHVKPLSEINEQYKINPIEDLRPVCPNCHAMLHKKIPAYSIEEIRNFINQRDL